MTTTTRFSGLTLRPHQFTVPLDYANPGGETITVFARTVVATARENDALPWLVFLQGGPGFSAPRPDGKSGWLKRALQEYRVLLLDQRGTGRSSPITFQTLARFSPAEMAAYLKHFRADAIVQDAEFIRRRLAGENTRWSVLGQSYGGFCGVHYLSAAPDGLREVFFTGGLPSLVRSVDEVYRATYQRTLDKNALYYARYSDDAARTQEIVRRLLEEPVALPVGGWLSPQRVQQLGMGFGASYGFETVHYLLEGAFVEGINGLEFNFVFLRGVENVHPFDTNPIYAILHEAIYCQGEASRWAAERVRAEFPAFELAADRPVMFTGEMIYPSMFDDFAYLRPLKEAAHILAEDADWPRLYDVSALQANTVPCAAAIYYNDMYVERTFSEETARTIRGIKTWVTSEYEHNGLRADGEKVLGRLIDMARGEIS
ncbi:MAG: alpha/beta fold hydrolase [Anaerolineales bacterium]|nr:alpha/beta fold hydrolase [Anaerolineales bacterium]